MSFWGMQGARNGQRKHRENTNKSLKMEPKIIQNEVPGPPWDHSGTQVNARAELVSTFYRFLLDFVDFGSPLGVHLDDCLHQFYQKIISGRDLGQVLEKTSNFVRKWVQMELCGGGGTCNPLTPVYVS